MGFHGFCQDLTPVCLCAFLSHPPCAATDRETGRPRGFGYVDFETPEAAAKAAAALNQSDMEGRSIKVEVAQPRGQQVGYLAVRACACHVLQLYTLLIHCPDPHLARTHAPCRSELPAAVSSADSDANAARMREVSDMCLCVCALCVCVCVCVITEWWWRW